MRRIVYQDVAWLMRNVLREAEIIMDVLSIPPDEVLLLIVVSSLGLRAVRDLLVGPQPDQVQRVEVMQCRGRRRLVDCHGEAEWLVCGMRDDLVFLSLLSLFFYLLAGLFIRLLILFFDCACLKMIALNSHAAFWRCLDGFVDVSKDLVDGGRIEDVASRRVDH